jgi:hypothetical protein
MMVKKRVRAARAMVTRVVDDKESGGDRGNMVRYNDDGLIPIVVQQAALYSASTSLNDAGNNDDWGNDQMTTTVTTTSSCRPLMLHVATPSFPLVSHVAFRGVIHSDY